MCVGAYRAHVMISPHTVALIQVSFGSVAAAVHRTPSISHADMIHQNTQYA